MQAVQLELQGLKAMGYQAVMIELPFPMLYEPFYSSQAQYQQFVNFYTQVASTIRGLGMKIVIENDSLFPIGVYSGWSAAPFYATLDWTQYKAARAQTAKTVAQIMQPDYMVLMEEPDTEATNSGQTEVNTVAGATSMVSQILTSVRSAKIPGMKVGAGMCSWYSQYLAMTQSLAALPLDFIDMHIYMINDNFLDNALTIAQTAAAAGKPVAMTECWLYKIRDSELNVLSYDDAYARNPFNFWETLDSHFIETMKKLGNYTKMYYWSPFSTFNFRADLPYDSSTENLTYMEIKTTWAKAAGTATQAGDFTPTGVNAYNMLISPPNTKPPTTPTDLTGGSATPTTAGVSWSASTDAVGVAGYNVFRDGVKLGTTALRSYQDSGLTQATTYTYAVSAYDLGGNTSPEETVEVTTKDVTPPSTPAHLVTAVVSTKQINLTWSPSTDLEAVADYYVFRGTTPAGLSQVGLAAATTSPSFISYPLTPGTTYYFAVEAMDTSGNVSAMSAVVSAKTLAPPTAPTKLVATPDSTTAIGLTWVAGASGLPLAEYRIFRGTSPSNLSQVAVNTKTSYTDTGLTPGTKYYYAVEEEDTGGDLSPLSATVSATTP
jgi:fibronectin type 3 domain-containing protein